MKLNFKNTVLLLGFLMSATACSMKDRTEVHSVSVKLPSEWVNSTNMSVLNHHGSTMSTSYFTAPTGLTSFQCYALNVTGPGIQADPRYGCTNPDSGMGLIAGFMPISSGSIEMMVPAGADRKVNLIGIQSTIGCPLLNDLLNAGGVNALDGLGDPYLLGTTVTDIFDDTAVTILASFDSTKKAFSGCGNNGGAGSANTTANTNTTQTLSLQGSAGLGLVQNGHCSMVGISANNVTSGMTMPAVLPSIISISGGGSASFYTDQNCINQAGAYITMPNPMNGSTNSYLPLYVLLTGGTVGGTISGKVDTTATGWTLNPTTLTIVPNRLEITFNSNTTPSFLQTTVGSCEQVNVKNLDGATAQVAMSALIFKIHNDTNSGVLPSVNLYSDSSCTAAYAENGSTTTEKGYKITVGNTNATFYMKDIVQEKIHFDVSHSVIITSEPAGAGVDFTNLAPSFALATDPLGPSGSGPCNSGVGCSYYGTGVYMFMQNFSNAITPLINNPEGIFCSASGLPQGFNMDQNTCAITRGGTPSSGVNQYPVTITVTKAGFAAISTTFTIKW